MDAGKIARIGFGKQASTQRKGRKLWQYCAGTLALMGTLSLAGCYGPPLSTREKGTLIGGAVGAGGGALTDRRLVLLVLARSLAVSWGPAAGI